MLRIFHKSLSYFLVTFIGEYYQAIVKTYKTLV
jgi:hypothetical protein